MSALTDISEILDSVFKKTEALKLSKKEIDMYRDELENVEALMGRIAQLKASITGTSAESQKLIDALNGVQSGILSDDRGVVGKSMFDVSRYGKLVQGFEGFTQDDRKLIHNTRIPANVGGVIAGNRDELKRALGVSGGAMGFIREFFGDTRVGEFKDVNSKEERYGEIKEGVDALKAIAVTKREKDDKDRAVSIGSRLRKTTKDAMTQNQLVKGVTTDFKSIFGELKNLAGMAATVAAIYGITRGFSAILPALKTFLNRLSDDKSEDIRETSENVAESVYGDDIINEEGKIDFMNQSAINRRLARGGSPLAPDWANDIGISASRLLLGNTSNSANLADAKANAGEIVAIYDNPIDAGFARKAIGWNTGKDSSKMTPYQQEMYAGKVLTPQYLPTALYDLEATPASLVGANAMLNGDAGPRAGMLAIAMHTGLDIPNGGAGMTTAQIEQFLIDNLDKDAAKTMYLNDRVEIVPLGYDGRVGGRTGESITGVPGGGIGFVVPEGVINLTPQEDLDFTRSQLMRVPQLSPFATEEQQRFRDDKITELLNKMTRIESMMQNQQPMNVVNNTTTTINQTLQNGGGSTH